MTVGLLVCSSELSPYMMILSIGYHFGALINGLILICVLMGVFFGKNKTMFESFLVVICALGAGSDLLFYVSFLIPSILTLGASQLSFFPNKLDKENLPSSIFLIFLGGFLGIIIKSLITHSMTGEYILCNPIDIVKQLNLLYDIVFVYLKKHFVIGVYMGSFYAIILYQLFSYSYAKERGKLNLLRLFLITSLILTVIAIVTNGLLNYEKIRCVRYILNFFWFPIIFAWLPFSEITLFQKPIKRHYIFSMLFFVLGIGVTYKFLEKNISFVPYYPSLVQCIDKGIADYNQKKNQNIRFGIGQYWHAKMITEFSKENLYVNQYLDNLIPFVWINNPDNFREQYDFAVLPYSAKKIFRISRKEIEDINGVASAEFQCVNEASILIFGKDQLLLGGGNESLYYLPELSYSGMALKKILSH